MKVTSLSTVAFSVPLDDAATTESHPLGIPSLSYVLVRAATDEGLDTPTKGISDGSRHDEGRVTRRRSHQRTHDVALP